MADDTEAERGGMIKHLSASSLSLFKSSPALWVGKYLLGWEDEVGAAAWRGSAVEAGLDVVVFQSDRLDPIAKAMERFELDAQGDASEEVQKHRALIPAFLDQASQAVSALGVPIGRQFQIEYRFGAPIEWPLIGFLDYLFPEFLFDLKTTERMPSEPRADHVMQCALYAAATERPAKLLYVTPKKSAWFDVTPEMQAWGLAEARRLAGNVHRLLKLSDDPHELLAALPCDWDNFRWNDNLKKLALEAQAA